MGQCIRYIYPGQNSEYDIVSLGADGQPGGEGKMQTLATGLIKGFTILEILIVLAIISISGTSFYLILNEPKVLIRINKLSMNIKC